MERFIPLGAQQEDEEAEASQPLEEKVVTLINDAQLQGKEKKLECLFKVRELIINKDPALLDSFFDEVTAFQQDPAVEVRKFVVGFMEDARKKDPHMLTRAVPLLHLLMYDGNVNIQKRVIVCFMQLYRLALTLVCKTKVVEKLMEDMWETLSEAKTEITNLLTTENEGVRTLAIKFMEMVILSQTKKEPGSEPPRANEPDFSLDMVPTSHPLLKTAALREEAGMVLGKVLELSASPEISSVNLMACVGTLCTVAKQRPMHISTVVQAFELLQANLPIHFSSSQINSVSKHLKSQLLGLLRQPASFDSRAQITTLLTALGSTQSEIIKNTPKVTPENLKRQRSDSGDTSGATKKSRLTLGGGGGGEGNVKVEPDTATKDPEVPLTPGANSSLLEAIELTTADLKPQLVPEVVVELVMANMAKLPHYIPRNFQHTYTPIASAGNEAQVTHLARLLASQMTSAGIGVGAQTKGIQPHSPTSFSPPDQQGPSTSSAAAPNPVVSDPRKRKAPPPLEEEREKKRPKKEEAEEEPPADPADLADTMKELSYLGSLLGMPDIFDPSFSMAYTTFFGDAPPMPGMSLDDDEMMDEGESKIEPDAIHTDNLVVLPTAEPEEEGTAQEEGDQKRLTAGPQRLKKIRRFDLSSVVRPLSPDKQQQLSLEAFKRILAAEKVAAHRGASQDRTKLIISLVIQFGGEFNDVLLEFILNDLRSHFDLAMAWLYAEYGVGEGYLTTAQNNLHYDSCLTGLLTGAKRKLDSRDRLFVKFVLEAPCLTPSALEIIKSYCREEERAFLGLCTLRDLVMKRTRGTEDYMQALLEVTKNELELARVQALHIAKRFYTKPELTAMIERFAVQGLQNLLSDHPTFQQQQETDLEVAIEWSEDAVRTCSGLFLSLLPLNHKLLKELAIVYTNTTATVKRILLKFLDQPVQTIGMSSHELLDLVAYCPSGAETLIMRMLHILTESAPPSPELVQRVRELYQKNSSDVRFLIPVLHGLQKHEVIAALPKFIRLTPNVVRGVFDKLLVSYKGEQGHSMSPVTPSELLIALHNIDCRNDEATLKAVVRATNLCFAEKSVYTQEVLAVVLQHLMDQNPVPMLFMRTVIQSLGVCPRLVNFVMTILTKLINKQVWKLPKVWQGFVKCCEVTKPHSYQVLLHLPPDQLGSVLEMSTVLRESLIAYLQQITTSQRAQIPQSVLQIIEHGGTDARKVTKKSKSSKRRSSKTSEELNEENTPS